MQLEIIRMVQRLSNPILGNLMEGVTIFAEPALLAAVFCAIYWCANKRFGQYLAFALGVTACLNGILKDIFRVERIFNRPGFEETGIVSRRVETATGYSFPSGHTQTAATFWGGVFILAKSPVVRVLTSVLVAAIAFSRIYLGVHYPLDVIAGLIFGAVVSVFMHRIMIVHKNRALIGFVCVAAIILALVTGVSEDTYRGAGLLLGVLSGILFEERLVRFETGKQPFFQMALRYATGMVFVYVIYLLSSALLPVTMAANAIKYAVIAFLIMGLYPYIFTKLKF